MRTNIFRRAVVAGASAAVALVGLGTVTSTAQAADVSLKFNCSVSILTGEEFGFDAAVEVPATAEQGKPLTLSFDGTVSASNTVRQSAYYILNARALSGTADIDAKFGGQDLPLVAQVARTEVPGGTEVQPLVLPAKGSATFTPTAVGTQTVTIAGFKANLKSEKSDGTTADVEATCVAKDAAAAVATVEVTKSTAPAKVATKTTAKASYAKKAKKATVNVKVVNNKKKAVQGKVKLTLKKGKKVVGKRTVTLSKKGVAKGVFTKVKAKGKYTVIAEFQGNKTAKKSKATAKFTVK